jgi:threonine dehydratase
MTMAVTLESIKAALVRIEPFISRTPIIRLKALEGKLNPNIRVYLKMDSKQPTGSFKVRGAFNFMLQLDEGQKKKGVVTRSSGNFAQGVAYAASRLGINAIIVMPHTAPKIKLEGVGRYNPEIQFTGKTYAEQDAAVQKIISERNCFPLHPYNHYWTIAGQGTAALEILEDCPGVQHFFCPIGGGGLMSGCATALKETNADIRTYGVEPDGAGDYCDSRKSGRPKAWEKINTIADGLGAPSVGDLNYPLLNKYVDEVCTVTDEQIKTAMKWLFEEMDIISEPSGAVALAGLMFHYQHLEGDVVVLLSGQNVDPESFKKWIEEANPF